MRPVVPLLSLVLSCGGEPHVPAVDLREQGPRASLAASEQAPADAGVSGGWFDVDALPAGARFRLGSNVRHAADVLAVSNDGLLAMFIRGVGLVEVGLDWRVRRLPFGASCTPHAGRYVDGGLLVACGDQVLRFDAGGATTFPIECNRLHIFSARGTQFACVTGEGPLEEVRVYDTTIGARWISGPFGFIRWGLIVVSDSGVVVVPGDEALVAFSSTGVLWRMAGEHRMLGLDPSGSTVVAWDYDLRRFHVVSTKDGSITRSTPSVGFRIQSNVEVLPGRGSWLVVTDETPPAVLRVDDHTAVISSSWPAPPYTQFATISADGRHAALSRGMLTRFEVDSPAPATDMAAPLACRAMSMVASPSGDRMVVGCRDGGVHLFDMASGGLIGSESMPYATAAIFPLAIAPQGDLVAAANPFDGVRVFDASTLAERCRVDGIRATSLHWGGGHVVAVHEGSLSPYQPEVAELTVMDAQCKLLAPTMRHHGRMVVLGADERGIDVALASEWGDIMDPSTSVRRVAFATGKSVTGAPRALADGRERAAQRGDARGSVTGGGSTRALVERSGTGRALHCLDAVSGRRLATYELPPTVPPSPVLGVAPNGAWVSVEDVGSVLVYPCRSAP